MANIAIRYTVAGVTRRVVRPRDGNGRWKGDANLHPAHRGREAADLFAEILGFGVAAGMVNAWLAKWFPSMFTVDTGNGKGTGNGRGEPLADLPGVSLKIRSFVAKGGKRSSKLTTLREASARAMVNRDLPAFFAAGGDLPVVTVCLPVDADGTYILAEEEVLFHVSYPFREIAMRGFDGTVANARGQVGRAAKGTVLPTVWASHADTTCKGGSYIFYGAHPQTHVRDGWQVGTVTELRNVVAALIDRR